jgi:outer membrane protein OmpA-like peptidoglycan-associated protein
MRRLFFLALQLPLLSALAADLPNSHDHPLLSRYAGAQIIGYTVKPFDEYTLPLGRIVEVTPPTTYAKSEKVEGKLTRITYVIPKGRTAVEVYRNYANALASLKAQTLFEGAGDRPLGMFGVRYADLPMEQTGQVLQYSYNAQRFYAGRVNTPTARATIALYLTEFENGIVPNGVTLEKGQVVVQLDIVESAAMESGLVTAAQMQTALKQEGHVALYGIYFDSGKAIVKPESEPALSQIVLLLKSQPALKLYVAGHTDDTGEATANLELSMRRALAVVNELVSRRGIDGSRLTAAGVGPYSPVAPNSTEAGRAKNRRVELVYR